LILPSKVYLNQVEIHYLLILAMTLSNDSAHCRASSTVGGHLKQVIVIRLMMRQTTHCHTLSAIDPDINSSDKDNFKCKHVPNTITFNCTETAI